MVEPNLPPSCPDLFRASTSIVPQARRGWPGRARPRRGTLVNVIVKRSSVSFCRLRTIRIIFPIAFDGRVFGLRSNRHQLHPERIGASRLDRPSPAHACGIRGKAHASAEGLMFVANRSQRTTPLDDEPRQPPANSGLARSAGHTRAAVPRCSQHRPAGSLIGSADDPQN